MTSSLPAKLILYHYVLFPRVYSSPIHANEIFHQHFSPYAHKILYYLTLRSIPYFQCPQPLTLPRPDLSQQLGITYRRIPLLAIGNTVFIDTPLILSELERRFPSGALGGGEEAKQWSRWSDRVFRSAIGCIPQDLPTMKDPAFRKDREDFSGKVCHTL